MRLEGSRWRRWDLHIHTPDTILNDQFGDWEEFLDEIAAHPEVAALGVTDYLSIENYSRMRSLHQTDPRLKHVRLLIPNVEFRIAPPTEKSSAINMHLLISPEDTNHQQETLDALARLHWKFDGRRYSCLPKQLTALGKAFDKTITDDRAALRVGTNQFKVDFAAFRDWYNNEPWLRQNSLVAVAAGEDGLSGFQKSSGWAALRDEVTRFSQIVFSGRPGEREFWLGDGAALNRETVHKLGGPKPCIHGSDAHKIASLFKPEKDRFCWIKADATFEGLRQTLYEPGDRVHIGPSPPVYHDEARVIRQVQLLGSDGWFDDIALPLNPSLVSIIGQKGSGKSALAELIAFAAGSWESDSSSSFLHRATGYLDSMTVELTWADGAQSKVKLWEGQSGLKEIRYLSQRFVEQLCSEDSVGEELVREIESVIFSNIDPTDTLNASSFSELRTIRTEGTRADQERIKQEILLLIRTECDLREASNKLPDKRARVKTLSEESKGLTKQIPKAKTPEEAAAQQELQKKRQELNLVQQSVARHKQHLQRIVEVRARIASFEAQIRRFASEIQPALRDLGIAEKEEAFFRPAFARDSKNILDRKEEELKKLVADREGANGDPAQGTIRWLLAQIKKLSDVETADKVRQEKNVAIQTRLAAIAAEIEKINSEISQIDGPIKAKLVGSRDQRQRAYLSYFENLRTEEATLQELYSAVKANLGEGADSQSDQNLEFAIRWDADLDKWLERGSVLFDQRRANPFGSMQDLGRIAKQMLVPAWTSGDPISVAGAHSRFLDTFNQTGLAPQDYLRSGVSLFDLLSWLYEVDHIELTYGLKYNGVELEKLSPGTKGIVLLILYLGMDRNDSRPLVVDQPDENLDNESIYKLLTTYFKQAKNRRQIILITHNPNLVVNADSEQVIIASCVRGSNNLPHIEYQAGALEHESPNKDGIRDHVCRILEGGADAFHKRERRYSLPEIL